MTREEEIEKAARSAFPYKGEDDMRAAYIRGAKWALKRSPWISVKEKLPKKKEVVLIHCYPYGVITALFDDAWEGVEVPELFYSTDVARQLNEVDHWMPIPPLPKKGGGE